MGAAVFCLWVWSAVASCAAALIFYRHGRSLAESGAFALAATILALTLVFEVELATGRIWPGTIIQAVTAGAGSVVIWRHRAAIAEIRSSLLGFANAFPLPFAGAAVALGYRGLAATAGARLAGQAPLVKAVLGSQAATLTMAGPLAAAGTNQEYPGLLAFMAYGIVGLATYALSRRHAWPPTAATAALVVLSAPRFAHCQPETAPDLIAAAMAAVVLLAIYRALEQPCIDDLLVALIGIGFLWSDPPLGWALPAVLAGLAVMMLYRRYGLAHLVQMIGAHYRWTAGAIALALVVSPAWTGTNAMRGGQRELANNSRGIVGAGDNLARAMLGATTLGVPQAGTPRVLGRWWQASLERFYAAKLAPLTNHPDVTDQLGLEGQYGFGPLALVLTVPAIVYALATGPRRLRALATALVGYLYIIVLVPAWSRPPAIGLLSPLMVLSGAAVAFFLPPWRLTRRGRRSLQIACLLVLAFGLIP